VHRLLTDTDTGSESERLFEKIPVIKIHRSNYSLIMVVDAVSPFVHYRYNVLCIYRLLCSLCFSWNWWFGYNFGSANYRAPCGSGAI